MNAAHYHIALTHTPLTGIVSGFALLLAGVILKNTTLKKAALYFFLISAAIAVPVYLSGQGAEKVLKSFLPNMPHEVIEQHEEMAALALGGSIILGVISLVFAIVFRGERQLTNMMALILIVIALIVIVLTGYTANLGGKIRHVEIRASIEHKSLWLS
ncbi:MAG: hypothetical protein ACP5MG_00140 [Verrucomicrobiia bacterium]|jgi:uncharacterized membrane protein